MQIRVSVLRKLLSPCLGYAADFKLLFLLFDIFSARRIMGIQKIASVRGVSAEIASQNRADSEAYWRREQDYLCDIVRQMEARQELPENADLYAYTHHGTAPRSLAYPNVFITIAPAEWRFPLHQAIFDRWKHVRGSRSPIAPRTSRR